MLEWLLTFILDIFLFFILLIIFYFTSPIFIKIDLIIINFFTKIKNFIINILNKEISFNLNNLLYKKIIKHFNILSEKTYLYLFLNYPEFIKLIRETFNLYKSNRNFILTNIRKYLYISILLYIIVWFSMASSLFINSIYLVWITKKLLYLYGTWTYPIRKFRFLIGYLVRLPINTIRLVTYIFYYIWEFFFPKIEPKSIFK